MKYAGQNGGHNFDSAFYTSFDLFWESLGFLLLQNFRRRSLRYGVTLIKGAVKRQKSP